MNTVLIVAIVFGSLLSFVALVCGTLIVLVRSRHSGISKKSRQYSSEEAKMIQEIYKGLNQMEKRIESLETILMDKQDRDK